MEVVDGRPWTAPVPLGEGDYGTFYEHCAEGHLMVQECPACGHRQHYPRALCTSCGATPGWIECQGWGTVHTFTVMRRNRQEPFKSALPYAVAVVELPEGPMMLGRITDVDANTVAIGDRVEAYAVVFDDGRALPHWRPHTT